MTLSYKKIVAKLLFAFILFTGTINAQSWQWLTGAGSASGGEIGRAGCTDAAGNAYFCGNFNGSVSIGGFPLTSAGGSDIFVAKFNAAGTCLWAVGAGSSGGGTDAANGITTDGTNVFITGTFAPTSATFGAFTLTTNTATSEGFFACLNASSGAFTWAVNFSNTPGGGDVGHAMCIDGSGNPYAIGNFNGTVNFGSASYTSAGVSDVFVAKINPANGAFVWGAVGGSTGADNGVGSSICYVPGLNEIVAGASFGAGTATFATTSPVSGPFTFTNSGSNDIVLMELNASNGAILGALQHSGANQEDLLGMCYDPSTTNVMLTGHFQSSTITFGSTTLTNAGAAGTEDVFIASYNPSTNTFPWAVRAGGTLNERGWSVSSSGTGVISVTGQFRSSPTAFGSTNLNASGFADVFVTALIPSTGAYVWAIAAAGNSATIDDVGRSVAYTTNGSGNVYVCGQFSGTFTAGALPPINSAGNGDIFFAKLLAPPPLTATQSQVNLTCNGVCTGSATVVASGGVAPYTYSWSPSGGSGATASSLCATNYTVTITDAVSSSITKTFNITQPPAIVITPISQTNVSCFGGSNGAAQVTTSGGTGTLTYNWTPGNPTGDGTGSVTGLIAQVYTVTVTDANSCTATRTFNITAPPALSVTPSSQTNVSCFGGSNGAAAINTPTGGAGGYTYNWTPGNPTGDGTVSVTGLTAQVYTVTVTDANSCTATATFNVTAPPALSVTPSSQTNVSCFGGSNGAAAINTPTGGAGGYTYNWTPGNPTGDGTVSVTGLTAQVYTVTVTDANSCTATATFNVTAPPVLSVTPSSQTNVSCFGGSNGAASINTPTGGAGGYTYNWTPGNPTGDGTVSVTGLTAQVYTVTVTDANSCTATATFNITQPTSPVSGTTVVTNVACFGGNTGAINLTPTGGTGPYTFNWLPSGPTTEDRTGLIAGTYSVQITDVNGCTGTVTATVTQPTSPVSGTTVVTNTTCFGGNNGAINLTPSGGTGPYTFNWLPSGPTTEDRTGLTAGTYSVQITDVNGCTSTVTATVTQPVSTISGTTVVTNVSCFGGSNGAINLTPSGGSPGYTFNWLPSGPTTEDRTGLTAGTYSVQITDVNGCTGTVTATVTQPTSPVSGTTVVTNVACFGGNTGAINLTPTGGTGPYTFNWLPSGPTTEDRTGLTAGTYSVQITDVNGCTGTVTATVTQPTSPVSGTTVVTNVACFGGNTGAINLTPTGGTGPYTFNWLPSGPTTEDRTGLIAGTYSVQITDVNGCTGTITATVTQPTSPVSGTTVVTNVSCFGGSNGAINLTPAGGTGPYTFNWLPSGPTTEDRTGLTAGTYSVQITDNNGCTSTVTATVTQPTSPVSGTTVVTNIACFGGATGAINLTPTGGTGPYTFNWLPSGPTTEDRTGLTAGTYSVQITDINGCTGTVTATVTQPPVLAATVTATSIDCFGNCNGTATANVTGGTPGYTYSWSPSGGTAATATGLCAGTYTITITDANGCTITRTVSITQPPVLIATNASQTNVSCNGGSNGSASVIVTGGTGAYTYAWTPSGGNAATASGLIAGNYTCTVTDANLCSTTATFLITEPPALTFTTMQTDVSCNGGADGDAMVMVTGGTPSYTYAWSPSGGNADLATGLTAGSYTCVITDANLCTASATFTIAEPSAIVYSSMQTNVSCNGGSDGSAMVMASGGTGALTYAWAPTGGNAATATGLIAGNYTVTITDANLCTASATFLIIEPTPITVTSTQTNVSCSGGCNGSATVSVTGGTPGYTYLWSPSGGNAATATGLCAGTYTLVVTDANGCTTTTTVSITEPTPIVVTSTQTNVSCFGACDGSATVVVSGGTPGYTYAWMPAGGNAATATGLCAGTYTLTVTDANGCTTTQTVTITEPAVLVAGTIQNDPTCVGANTGDATVMPSGGTAPYTYLWAPTGGTGQSELNLTAGSYTCTVTDANGCTTTATVTLVDPPAITFTQAQTDVSCSGGNNGDATVTASGGTGTLSYLWAPSGGTGATESNLTAGSYTVTITDANLCTTTATFLITEPAALAATVDSTSNPTACGATDGAIYITVTGGTGAYTYAWDNSAVTEDNTGIGAGTYSVTITDANGCTTTASASINDPGAPTVTLSLPVDTACGDFPGTINLTGESPAGGTFSGTAVTGNTFDPFTAGMGMHYITYTFTDINGCTGSTTDSIFVNTCIGIQTIGTTTQWNLFPNPTNGLLTIASPQNVNGNVMIDVLGTDGKLIMSETKSDTKNMMIDLGTMPAGVYFIRITGNENVSVYRIVKM